MTPPEGHSYADLHLHTHGSDGLWDVQDWLDRADAAGVALVGITDHDSVRTVREYRRNGGADPRLIPGVELTARGRIVHVGVLFLDEIPEDLPKRDSPLLEVMRWARGVPGALVILVHPQPFLWRRQLRRLARAGLLPDAIETRFPIAVGRTRSFEAAAERYDLAVMGGTDAHLLPAELGRHVTAFPGSTAEDFARAVRARTTRAVTRPAGASPPRSLYLIQGAYSWLLPFDNWTPVARIRRRLLGAARRRAVARRTTG